MKLLLVFSSTFIILALFPQAHSQTGTTEPTTTKLDVLFLLDSSTSINNASFAQSVEAIRRIASNYTIAPDRVRTSLIVFGRTTRVVSRFDQHTSNEEFDEVLNTNLPRMRGTRIGAVLNALINEGFSEGNGVRPASERVPRILVIFTDGKSSGDILSAASKLQQAGIATIPVGVGRNPNLTRIGQITNNQQEVFTLNSTNTGSIIGNVESIVVEIARNQSINTTASSGLEITTEETTTTRSLNIMQTTTGVMLQAHSTTSMTTTTPPPPAVTTTTTTTTASVAITTASATVTTATAPPTSATSQPTQITTPITKTTSTDKTTTPTPQATMTTKPISTTSSTTVTFQSTTLLTNDSNTPETTIGTTPDKEPSLTTVKQLINIESTKSSKNESEFAENSFTLFSALVDSFTSSGMTYMPPTYRLVGCAILLLSALLC